MTICVMSVCAKLTLFVSFSAKHEDEGLKEAFGNCSNISVGSTVKTDITPLKLEVRGLAGAHIYSRSNLLVYHTSVGSRSTCMTRLQSDQMLSTSRKVLSNETQPP